MARATQPAPSLRAVQHTILVVGAGHAEVAFLHHLRRLFEGGVQRSITVANARAQGVDKVVMAAISAYKKRPHNRVVVVCSGSPNAAANFTCAKKPVQVITVDPCFEALLLRMHGDATVRSAPDHRQAFARRFGAAADSQIVLSQHFALDVIETTKPEHPELAMLLSLLGH